MSLLEMSFAGGVLILAAIVLRSLTLNRLPKATFLALWAVAVLRLLLPFSIPSPASVYTLAERTPLRAAAPTVTVPVETPSLPAASFTPSAGTALNASAPSPESGAAADVWGWIWLAGAMACGTFFLLSYFRCRREFRTALPAEDQALLDWLAGQKLRRTVSLRRSDRVDAPLTYGLLRPVILLPEAGTDVSRYALEHELVHIRRLDALWKPLLAFTACVHWFNPLAWAMFILANRDMELRCDEAVVRRFGAGSRSAYALALLSMEEKRSGLGPFASAFSKNAIEERIIAIMKMKKRSLAAILAAVVLVCCVGVGFATSAAEDGAPYPVVQDGTFTKKELDRLASLWFEGYRDMTVAEYQQKMWTERDTRSDMALIERYSQNNVPGSYLNDGEGTKPDAFRDYFYQVYEPLTAQNWQERTFSDAAVARTENGGTVMMEYDLTMRILDPDVLTVGEYERRLCYTKTSMERLVQLDPPEDQLPELYTMLSSTTPDGALEITTTYASPNVSQSADPDADLHAQSSKEAANQWDSLLSPYAPFGLTWEFNDPDLDGNGLTMWFQGREVRGIMDEQEGVWITEHTGNSTYSDGAVELYTVYTDGKLSGLRFATPEEQAQWDADRQRAQDLGPATIVWGTLKPPGDPEPEEQREFPQATKEDYEALLTLRGTGFATVSFQDPTGLSREASLSYQDYMGLSLEDFNQRLLDWANENTDAWDRINCDVIWNDCGVELTPEEWSFVSLTCALSGTENGQKVRALHTGRPEEDPGFSANLPEKFKEENGIRTAWCNLYYNISYHIADKSAATVRERDALAGGMMDAINAFWQNTDLDALLTMTEEDVVSWLNTWAEEASTENIRFDPITEDNVFFEKNAEWGIE